MVKRPNAIFLVLLWSGKGVQTKVSLVLSKTILLNLLYDPSCSQLRVVENGIVITIKTTCDTPWTISPCEIRIRVPPPDHESIPKEGDKVKEKTKLYLTRDYKSCIGF